MRTTETIVTRTECGIDILFRIKKLGAKWFTEILMPDGKRVLVGVTKTKGQAYDIIDGIMALEPETD